jgi:hypothetical protein
MGYADRVELYKKIEEIRKRPLITYVTSSRQNAAGMMGSDVIPEFCKQLDEISPNEQMIDVLIVSHGGDPMVSWRVISLLRERFKRVGVLLPAHAYSSATLLALGADEIQMHPYSNLGPVDPQLHGMKKVPGKPEQNEEIHFGAEDLAHFIEFVTCDVGITDQEQKERAFELVCNEVGAIPIGIAKRSSNLSLSSSKKLLSLHMKDQSKVVAIAESLNKSFYHHGYPVGRQEAKKIGLPVRNPDPKLEALMWQVWIDLEGEMQCNNPFHPLHVALNDPIMGPQLSAPIPQIQIPPNAPPDLLAQVTQQILQQGLPITGIKPIDYELFQATIESTRVRSEFRTQLKIAAVRMPDLNIKVNVAPMSQGWKTIDTA